MQVRTRLPSHTMKHKQALAGAQRPSRSQTHSDKRSEIKPQIHSFACLVWGGGGSSLGAGLLETQIQETEGD